MLETNPSLLRRLQNVQDHRAWEKFFSTYEPLLRNYARKRNRERGMGWCDSDVDDLVQEIVIKLYRKMPTFRYDPARGKFRVWLWRVTVNAMTDRVRSLTEPDDGAASEGSDRPPARRRRTQSEGDEGLGQIADPNSESPEDAWDDEYWAAVLAAVHGDVRQSLADDPSHKWASYKGRYIDQRPAAEIAAELGITANHVYQNAHRVFLMVKERVQTEYGEELG
jgi:RNA polymerase sigma-70 factor (ECF subfamily)